MPPKTTAKELLRRTSLLAELGTHYAGDRLAELSDDQFDCLLGAEKAAAAQRQVAWDESERTLLGKVHIDT